MKATSWWTVGRTVALLVLAAVAGALAGTAAALVVTPLDFRSVPPTDATSTVPTTTPTTTVAELSLTRLEPRLASSVLPPEFLSRRASPVAAIYRKARGATVDERILTDDRLLGQGVALTSDGWIVTQASVVGSLSVSELTVWINGKSASVTRGVTDRVNGTAYLKIAASDLTAPAFGQVMDLVPGSEIWMERRAGALSPTLVTILSERMPTADPGGSETANRRIRLDAAAREGDRGSPAWDSRGALVGLIESAVGEPARVIPSSSIASSFASLLNQDAIRHASLGARFTDLAALRIDGDRGTLPLRGALLKDDRKQGKPAVAKDSPAAKAGLKAGDVILAVERDILDGTADLGEILSEYLPNTRATLRVWRNGTELDVPVEFGALVTSEPMKE